jgi:hypothetical protein
MAEYVMNYAKYGNQAYDFVQSQVQNAASALRTWLGPEPQNYYLLADGRIIPTTVTLPRDILESAFLFNYKKNRFTAAAETLTEGRFKPAVPYLSVVIKQPLTADIDLSEWVGELRANPVPENLPLKQLVTLWSLTNSQYVPLSYTLAIIDANGDYETQTVE